MRSPEQIAKDICNGDQKAKSELEKMMGKSLIAMTKEERTTGLICLSALESQRNK